MKTNVLQNETAKNSRLARIPETLKQRRSHCAGVEMEEDNSSTQFLQMQKTQYIDLQEHFERFSKILPVFQVNSAN